jgi:hypothetical protein
MATHPGTSPHCQSIDRVCRKPSDDQPDRGHASMSAGRSAYGHRNPAPRRPVIVRRSGRRTVDNTTAMPMSGCVLPRMTLGPVAPQLGAILLIDLVEGHVIPRRRGPGASAYWAAPSTLNVVTWVLVSRKTTRVHDLGHRAVCESCSTPAAERRAGSMPPGSSSHPTRTQLSKSSRPSAAPPSDRARRDTRGHRGVERLVAARVGCSLRSPRARDE